MSYFKNDVAAALQRIEVALGLLNTLLEKIMAGINDINSAETTLHADLVAQNGLIKQILAAFASGAMTPAQAQALLTTINSDDADAKSNIAAITAVLPPVTPVTPTP